MTSALFLTAPLYVNLGRTTDYIPSDLYFADLQWSYDGNRNNVFGEYSFNGDTVDLYYDVYLGSDYRPAFA